MSIWKKYDKELRQIKYPSRKPIREEVFAGMDEFVGTEKEIEEEKAARERKFHDLHHEAMKDYRLRRVEVVRRFKEELFSSVGHASREVNDKIYEYLDCHVGELHEIENTFGELVEIADFAYQLGKKQSAEKENANEH